MTASRRPPTTQPPLGLGADQHALAPEAPDFLPDGAVAVWNELVPKLEATQRIEQVDTFQLAMLCQFVHEWRETLDADDYQEIESKSGNSYRKESAESQKRRALAVQIVKLSDKLGIGVEARCRVRTRSDAAPKGEGTDLMSRKGRKAKRA